MRECHFIVGVSYFFAVAGGWSLTFAWALAGVSTAHFRVIHVPLHFKLLPTQFVCKSCLKYFWHCQDREFAICN